MTMDRFPIAYLAKGLLKVIEKDHDHRYVLQKDLLYRGIRTDHFQPFDYSDDILEFRTRGDSFDLLLKAGGDIYDGTTMLPDKGTRTLDALFKAHFAHDAVYEQSAKISNATGIPMQKLLAFADDVLKLAADHYGADRRDTSVIHTLLRSLGGLYHRVAGALTAIVLASLLFVAGCYSVRTTVEEFPDQIEYEGPIRNY